MAARLRARRAAASRGVAHRTPVVTSRTLDAMLGAQVFLKCENLQRMGAFKFRGAWNTISQLAPASCARAAWWRTPRAITRRRWRWSRASSAFRR